MQQLLHQLARRDIPVAMFGPDSTAASVGRADDADELFRVHRGRLWGLAYRLTGNAADAEDVVQETFARWIDRPRADAEPPAIGWLVRIATNLAIDALRARRRRAYPGAWLPSPMEASDEDWIDSWPGPDPGPESRYDSRESTTLAFLVALEVLGPRQRAALLLRDVFGYSASEAAALLGTSDGNVRILHLRARRAMQAYDRSRSIPTAELKARHRAAIDGFLACLAAQDESALASLLSESVRTVTDAGGEYTALRAPISGRIAVARFYVRAAQLRLGSAPTVDVRLVNGLPAIVVALASPVRRQAPRTVMSFDLDEDGSIREIRTVLASRKLTAIVHTDRLCGRT
jgi:RNA polymerase sigma-70 factor (ECF subfamily)